MSTLQEQLASGIAHKNEGEYDAAVAALEAVLSVEPACARARHELGLVMGFIGEFDRATDELRRAAELAPDDAQIRLDLGLTYAMIGMTDEAREAFEGVLRLDPGNKAALKNLSFFGP
jgi:Flp pilus assembly protein TadD